MQRHTKIVTFETADQICRDYLEYKRDIVNRPLNKLTMEQLAIRPRVRLAFGPPSLYDNKFLRPINIVP